MGDDAARVEAEERAQRRYVDGPRDTAMLLNINSARRQGYVDGFVAGAAWQAAQPVVVTAEHESLLLDVRTLLPILRSTELRDRWASGSPAVQALRDIERILGDDDGPLGITVEPTPDPPLFTARDTDGVEYEGGFTVEPTP